MRMSWILRMVVIFGVTLVGVGNAMAVASIVGNCIRIQCPEDILAMETNPLSMALDEDFQYEYTCYQNSTNGRYLKISSLISDNCPSGYSRQPKTYSSMNACPDMLFTYYDCVSDNTVVEPDNPVCISCDNCDDTDTWSAGNTGYETRTKKTCNTSTCICETSTEYQCAKGYYGKPISGPSGCTRCPVDNVTGVRGTTKNPGTTSVNGCVVAAETKFENERGSGVYSGDCTGIGIGVLPVLPLE